MFKSLLCYYLALGLEQDYMLHNYFGYTKKPNIIYRLYKKFDRQFREECTHYITGSNNPIIKKRNISEATHNMLINAIEKELAESQ